jgi:hypothetical protein
MQQTVWQPISTAPYNRDIELAVIEGLDTHALVARCRRTTGGWINAGTGKRIDVHPTHWREWPEKNG